MAAPVEQLALLHSEVLRQREENARRHGNMHNRAAVLIAASGIITGLQSGDLAHGWPIISFAFAIAAAGVGLWSFRPMRADEPSETLDTLASIGVNPYELEYRIVRDNILALTDGLRILDHKAKLVFTGYLFLVAGWVSHFVIVVLEASHQI